VNRDRRTERAGDTQRKLDPRVPGDTSSGVLARVAAGEEVAMRECIDVFGGLVWSLALRSTQHRQEAEDAVQDIFLSIWRVAERYRPELGSETVFVATIARRHLIDRFRRRPMAMQSLDDEEAPVQVAIHDSPESASDLDRVRERLHLLKPEERKLLDWAFLRGMTQSEIATATGMPLGTVKSHMRRGLLRLRALLDESGEEPSND
jgi:RNA polymerase sigma-70 factor (ECF subfamily)